MKSTTAILLMAYGGPDSLESVEPYLLDVRGGRPTSPELIEEIRHRYEVIVANPHCLTLPASKHRH